jgi:two-component system, chemotaxis family, chemotaxis protein CheY
MLEYTRIMVVDDNRSMLVLVRALLRGFGCRDVIEATDAAEAFEAMRSSQIDLLITDMAMRPLDGAEFARLVRTASDSPNPYVPIIMMTGHSDRHHVAAARDAGVNSFLVKPISARTLYAHINKAAQDKRGFVKTRTYFGPDRRVKTDADFKGPRRRADDHSLAFDLDSVASRPAKGF